MYSKQKKKERKEKRRKKEGLFFGAPRQRREELFPFVNRFVLSFLTKEEEGRARARTHTHTHTERVCVSERVCFALEKESGCKRGRVLLEGEKEREEKVSWGESAKKSIVLERACCCFIEEVR